MSRIRRIRVGSRKSPLSLAQTEEMLAQLRRAAPQTELVVVPMSTGGDRNKDAPLLSLGRGTFAKDIETALLDGAIDMAVHSAKDLPPELPEGLTIAAVGRRLDPRDVLVSKGDVTLKELPARSRIGTSSPRRIAQVLALRPDLSVLPIRGNVGTRIEKSRGDQYDGAIVAAAGLIRLGMEAAITEYLSPDICTPEVGQGTLAVETRLDATEVLELLGRTDDVPSHVAFRAERAFLTALGGGCKVPVTAFARLDGDALTMDAMAALPDGSRVFRTRLVGDRSEPESTGREIADKLLATGAREIVGAGRL